MTDHRRVLVQAGGLEYRAVVYWAKDSNDIPSVVIALPMGSLDEHRAILEAGGLADATPEDLLDWVVERIGNLGAQLLPLADDLPPARRN